MSRRVYTSITYDNDRNPLEDFLRAANYIPVPIEIGNLSFFKDAANDNPQGIAVVSSLINSRGLDIERAWDVLEQMESGIVVPDSEIRAAGFPDLTEGCYGDRLAAAIGKLPIPSLTVLFSSEYPQTRGEKVEFVLKRSFSRQGRDQSHAEIVGHLDRFFNGVKPA